MVAPNLGRGTRAGRDIPAQSFSVLDMYTLGLPLSARWYPGEGPNE